MEPDPTKRITLKPTIKFLCSYGGKILPRYPDGKLRYLGGETRVLAVHRSISFAELSLKLGELCGASASLRCQLPSEDLDALVSIKSDEDLTNLMEEYDRAAAAAATPALSTLKIRAFLSFPTKTPIKISSPPSSSASSSKSPTSSPNYSTASGSTPRFHMPLPAVDRCLRQISLPPPPPVFQKSLAPAKVHHCANYHAHGSPSRLYLVHNGNHWQ